MSGGYASHKVARLAFRLDEATPPGDDEVDAFSALGRRFDKASWDEYTSNRHDEVDPSSAFEIQSLRPVAFGIRSRPEE